MTDLSTSDSRRIDHAHTRLDGIDKRVTTLEMDAAVADERLRHIQASLDRINSGIGRLGWLVVTGLVGGVLAFILDGGLGGL
jgi:hypothetical protein